MNSAWDRMYLDFSQKRRKIVKLLAGSVPFPSRRYQNAAS
jgi:hypothetical protein